LIVSAKTAWIIGASSGIGAALADRLAAEGIKVAISARSADKLTSQAEQNANLKAYPLDVGDHVACKSVAEQIAQDFGSIDLVVFCAVRSGATGNFHENMHQGIQVGLLGATACLEPVMEHMVAKKSGHITLIGSPVGFRALPGTRSYGTVKAALHYLAESLRVEYEPLGINTQLILPGFVDTPLTRRNSFQMPFLMSTDKAVERIYAGLCKPHKFEIAFPRRLIWSMRLIATLPNFIYFALASALKRRMDSEDDG